MKKTICSKLILILISISMILSFLYISFNLTVFNENRFKLKYKEYSISEATGMSEESLMNVTRALLEYLKGDRENLILYEKVHGEEEQIFEERELLHMVDVKKISESGFFIGRISILIFITIIALLIFIKKQEVIKDIFYASIISIVFLSTIAFMVFINFESSFIKFHEILFNNDLWMLDINEDIMIQMYPIDFFMTTAMDIGKKLVLFLIGTFFVTKVFLWSQKTKRR